MEHIYVGIDWADDHHDVHVTDDSAKPLDSFTIAHSHSGMKELKERLEKFSTDPENILVAVEYHQGLLIYSLLDDRYQVYPINPKVMERYRDRYRMSSSKSDPKDAMVLANILRTDLHLYKPLSRESVSDARLKQLTRAHKSLVQEKVRLVNRLSTQLKNYYPVALGIFSRLDQKITLSFLEHYPTPEEAEAASIEELQDFFRKQHYPCPGKVPSIYRSLHKPALKAPEPLVDAHRVVVLSLISVLRSILTQIEKLEKNIALVFKQNPAHEIFSSLPAGEITTARLSGELGSDSSRYPSRDCLQTEAGTAPVTRRSGKNLVVHFRWQCNRHLRAALQDLGRESVKRCSWARRYFARQISLGHKPSRAYRALANRWAAIIWKMLQERQLFSQARLEKTPAKMQVAASIHFTCFPNNQSEPVG